MCIPSTLAFFLRGGGPRSFFSKKDLLLLGRGEKFAVVREKRDHFFSRDSQENEGWGFFFLSLFLKSSFFSTLFFLKKECACMYVLFFSKKISSLSFQIFLFKTCPQTKKKQTHVWRISTFFLFVCLGVFWGVCFGVCGVVCFFCLKKRD